MNRSKLLLSFAVLVGAVVGASWARWQPTSAAAAPGDVRLSDPKLDLSGLQSRLSMVMADYHTSNLWYAGRAQNWPLADYYWQEVLTHMELSASHDLTGRSQARLKQILKSIEDAPTMQVDEAIAKKDLVAFSTAYRNLLVGCYDCHKAAGKPYLRPRMPVPPSSSLINVNPNADWPQ